MKPILLSIIISYLIIISGCDGEECIKSKLFIGEETTFVIDFDSTITTVDIHVDTFNICESDFHGEYDNIVTFAYYLVGTWDIISLTKCNDSIDILDQFEEMKLRLDLKSLDSTKMVFAYISSKAEPIFETYGEIEIPLNQDISSDSISGVRDDNISIVIQNISINQIDDILEIELIGLLDCTAEVDTKKSSNSIQGLAIVRGKFKRRS